MRLLHAAAALTATSALALTLTACGGNDSGSSASDQSSAPASTPTASAAGSAPADNAAATTDPGSSTGTGTGTGTSSTRCHTAGLTFSFGPGDGTVSSSDDQQKLAVVLKNKGSATCTLQGFPGVDLKSADGSWSLVRSSVTPKKATLAPGNSATFIISYLPWTKGSGTEFKATSVVVTPPNETTSATLTWPGGSVLLQDGATHPGTYTGPIGG
ncbi:DUF4232 domain-containing protein [Streptomyces sp. NPDC059373]